MARPSDRSPYDNGRAVVNETLLVWPNSHGDDNPGFLIRGYYRDEEFACKDCGKKEIWTAKRQKWWYEVAKGMIFTKAVLCKNCRRKRRIQREKSQSGQ